MARIDPLRNFRYRLEIDSINVAGFSKVAIAESLIEAVDYREGIDPPHVRKLSGLTKYGNISLESGMTTTANGLDLFKWHAAVSAGQVLTQRKKVVIVVQDEAGADGSLPLRDPRVQQNDAYLAIIVLARVITRLGTLPEIHTGTIEGLYASDLGYLQRLYERFNGGDVDESAHAPMADNGSALRR